MDGQNEIRRELTQSRLRHVLHYDPESGVWTWLRPSGKRVKAGDVAGSPNGEGGRRCVGVDGVSYWSNRLAWFYMTGSWPPMGVDHKDRDPTNDRWENLRLCTQAQNLSNAAKRVTNTSGFKGVSFSKRQRAWQAQITKHYQSIHLGYFSTAELAHAAYCAAAAREHGDFACVA